MLCWLFGHRFDKVSAVHVDEPWGGWRGIPRHRSRYSIKLHCVRCGHVRQQYIKPPDRWGKQPPQTFHHGHNDTRPKRS